MLLLNWRCNMMKTILNTEIVQIYETKTEYQMLIKLSKGWVIEHNPFPRTLEGLVNALQLATEICAGKFYPMRVFQADGEIKMIGDGK